MLGFLVLPDSLCSGVTRDVPAAGPQLAFAMLQGLMDLSTCISRTPLKLPRLTHHDDSRQAPVATAAALPKSLELVAPAAHREFRWTF